jgi:4-hydroxyproline epimerase
MTTAPSSPTGDPVLPTGRQTFACIDGHTCGNPVRLVMGGHPPLVGATMSEKRQDFLSRFDWIRTALCFEPRGHDMMSGGFVYPPCSPEADASILFIETSGCLPMCGHGTIGMVTFALEHGLIRPRTPGKLVLDVPAGQIGVEYEMVAGKVNWVRLFNIDSFLYTRGVTIEVPELGPITLDISYGGNFYGIIEPQGAYTGIDDMGSQKIIHFSGLVRQLVREKVTPVHPLDSTIRGLSHVMWVDKPKHKDAHGRNAVFYGDRAIDRSPCGTGTSARMAHLAAQGKLAVGQSFVHESIIGSLFEGRVESAGNLGDYASIRPSIKGWAVQTGLNTIYVDPTQDPFWRGFQV